MTQDYIYNINQEIQDLLINYKNRAIRSTTDYQIITIGRLQIENLDWRWVPSGLQLNSLLMYDPYDCMFRHAMCGDGTGVFKNTKYGLSYRPNRLTLASYEPLWEPGMPPKDQAKIMWKEMEKMMKKGSKSCENGIEITMESTLWESVDSLANTARNTFRTLLGKKVQDLESNHIPYDSEQVWDFGVQITPEVLSGLRNLKYVLSDQQVR